VVSFALVVGSRSALVLVVPCGGGFVCLQCLFAIGVGFGPSRLVLAFVRPFAFGVGFGRSARALVSSRLFLGSAHRDGRPSRNLGESAQFAPHACRV